MKKLKDNKMAKPYKSGAVRLNIPNTIENNFKTMWTMIFYIHYHHNELLQSIKDLQSYKIDEIQLKNMFR